MAKGLLVCGNCKNAKVYASDEIINIGTAFSPIWAVSCSYCDSIIRTDGKKDTPNFPKNKDLIFDYDPESGGVIIANNPKGFKPNKKGNAAERAERGDIREYWVQKFFEEHYRDYGFKKVDGPYETGPDFFSGKTGIEIERHWRSYLDHKHHLNEQFDCVKFLIVLSPNEPSPAKRKLLPEIILYIDHKKFVPWFRIKAKEYANNKNAARQQMRMTLLLQLIKGEFLRRYLIGCPDKDRDMANCPACEMCPYCPELDFDRIALEFIVKYDYPLWDDEFSLGDINAKHLDIFFRQQAKMYL
jgi:hypothetical protein